MFISLVSCTGCSKGQGGINSYLQDIWELSRSDDGLAAWLAEPFVGVLAGGEQAIATPGLLQSESQSGREGYITGTGAIDWSEPESRMWYIANWFRELHSNQDLFDSVDDFDQETVVPWLDEAARW